MKVLEWLKKNRAASFVCICIPLGSTNMKIEKNTIFHKKKIEFSSFSSQCPLFGGYKLPTQNLTAYFIGLLQLVKKNWFDRIFEFMFIV